MQNSTHYAYCFEVKSVQNFLFSGGRLRHLVSASELLERLTQDILNKLIVSSKLKIVSPSKYEGNVDSIVFARRSGGALYLVSPDLDALKRFRLQLNLFVEDYLPGLHWVDGIAFSPSNSPYQAVSACLQILREQSNINLASLPVTSPISLLCERTSEPAFANNNGISFNNSDQLDTSLYFKELLQKNNSESFFNRLQQEGKKQIKWPVNLEKDFPLWTKNYIAIIHIDGNGLGQLLINLQSAVKNNEKEYLTLYPEFSDKLKNATENAVKKAIETLHKNERFYAARPVVVGGDDITFMVRAPEAISFTNRFIREFEYETEALISSLAEYLPQSVKQALPKCLSACAGVAFCNLSAPFSRIYERAEELCGLAKQKVKAQAINSNEIASAVAFEQLTTTPVNEYQSEKMVKYTSANKGYLSLEVYHTGSREQGNLPSLEKLMNLAAYLKKQQLRSKMRDYLGKLQNTPEIAQDFAKEFDRKHQPLVEELNKKLLALYQDQTKPELVNNQLMQFKNQNRMYSPLADLIELMNMEVV